MMDRVAFIISTPKQQSRHDHDLQIAKARSHAARISSISKLQKLTQRKSLSQQVIVPKRVLLPKSSDRSRESTRLGSVRRRVINRKQLPSDSKCRDLVSHSRSQDEAAVSASQASYNERKRTPAYSINLEASTWSTTGFKYDSVPTTATSTDTKQARYGSNAEDKYLPNYFTLDNHHERTARQACTHAKQFTTFNLAQCGGERIWRALHGYTATHEALESHPIPSLSISRPNLSSLDPFSSSPAMLDHEVKSTLYFYFKVIRPFVAGLIPGWEWFSSLSEAQSKPVLAYAVAALSSAFYSGCVKGGPGVVLPPLPSDIDVSKSHGEGLLWSIPPWLRLQATCIRELNKKLAEQRGEELDEGVFQAVLFLFRLSVLLADGPSARMHQTALNQMVKLGPGRYRVDMGKELAVQRINIVAAFCQPPSLVVVKTKQGGTHVIEVDRKDWDDKRYWSHLASLNGRVIAWRVNALRAGNEEVGRRPGDWIHRDCEAALEVMDPGGQGTLPETEWTNVVECYQIALYVIHYLNSVSYNTGNDGVRGQLLELKKRLEMLDLRQLHSVLPTTLFFTLLAGAMGCRGRLERPLFVRKLATLYERDVLLMDDVLAIIERCVDSSGLCWRVVEEIWDEVIDWRLDRWGARKSELGVSRLDLYKNTVATLMRQNHPFRYEKDLKKDRRAVVRETDFA